MNQWFRSWHGAPTDPKWLAIAQRTQTNAGTVSAVFWALMDHASQSDDRGDVSDFDVESYAAFSGFKADIIADIIKAFSDKNLIENNKLSAWEKRQPKREDGSAERSKEWRERKRTQTNAKEHREDKIREDKKESAVADDWPKDFREKFWELYPSKVGKAGALARLERVRKRGDVPWGKLISAVRAYAATADPKFTKHPITWLNQGCWDDQIGPALAEPIELDWENTISFFKQTGKWSRWAGPEPGQLGCRAPPEILKKHGVAA